jgi:putative DNA methylase
MNRRLIEDILPIKEIGEASQSERDKEHISKFHVWWARRPLSASRVTAFAALIDSKSDNQDLKEFLIKISKLKNPIEHNVLKEIKYKLKKQRKEINVLDPFGGGGSIPLETSRLGCNTTTVDSNPVATFLLKTTLEFPLKFKKSDNNEDQTIGTSQLMFEVNKWADFVFSESKNILSEFYPTEKNGNEVFTYIWARVIKCQNPTCGKKIPLFSQYMLSKKRNISLYPDKSSEEIKFKIVGGDYDKIPKGFDPSKGSVEQAVATCLFCGGHVGTRKRKSTESHLRNVFIAKDYHEEIVAVVSTDKNKNKKYRIATKYDHEIFDKAKVTLDETRRKFKEKYNIDPVPDEIIWTPSGNEYIPGATYFNFIFSITYGFTKWGDLFNLRQKLSFVIFIDQIRKAWEKMLKDKYDENDAKIIVSYLAIILDKILVRNSSFGVWHKGSEAPEKLFAFAGLPMKWSYPESNPVYQSIGNSQNAFTFLGGKESLLQVLAHLTRISNNHEITVKSGTVLEQDFKNNSFDAIFTDPPYYDMIHYSTLSDFFYVWLKRSVGFLFPDLFSTMLTPKSQECISELELARGMEKKLIKEKFPSIKDSIYYKENISKYFKKMYELLKNDGIAIIVFAHKSFSTWEIILDSILKSGFVVTATWPIKTEMESRQIAKEAATITSTIYIVCRKLEKELSVDYSDLKKELEQHIDKKIKFYWDEGIRGVDFFIALIGSTIEVFGKYKEIIDQQDNKIEISKLIGDVRVMVSKKFLKLVLDHEITSEISPVTSFYLFYRISFKQNPIRYDDARLLATGLGMNLEDEIRKKNVIKKSGNKISCIPPDKRTIEKIKNPHDLIDVLHKALLLWRDDQHDEIQPLLKKTGFSDNNTIQLVAKAISTALTDTNALEKKWIDSLLVRMHSTAPNSSDTQTKLF